MYVLHFLPFKTIKTLTLRMDHAKLLAVLMSLPVSQSILPRVVCFAKSRPANHAICSFIDSSGYASGPIRRCLFIDYIIRAFAGHTYHIVENPIPRLKLIVAIKQRLQKSVLSFCSHDKNYITVVLLYC